MSKMKKVLLMCTAYALVAAIAIGATLAFFTDRDSEVNTFTVGDVKIDLTEEFQQGAELVPGVKIDKNAGITNQRCLGLADGPGAQRARTLHRPG